MKRTKYIIKSRFHLPGKDPRSCKGKMGKVFETRHTVASKLEGAGYSIGVHLSTNSSRE